MFEFEIGKMLKDDEHVAYSKEWKQVFGEYETEHKIYLTEKMLFYINIEKKLSRNNFVALRLQDIASVSMQWGDGLRIIPKGIGVERYVTDCIIRYGNSEEDIIRDVVQNIIKFM